MRPADTTTRLWWIVAAFLPLAVIGDASAEVAGLVAELRLPVLPSPVTNNAVASVKVGRREYIVSFNGLGEGKTHSDVLATTYIYDSRSKRWQQAASVPGGVGRLASVAASAGKLVYVFGGYTVDADGTEASTPWTYAFNPRTREFEERAAIPVPVDDAVAVTYADRFIYLISGWHDLGNVNLVQRYDTATNTWDQATPTPGPAVFGHAGGIVGNTIVYCDGVAIEAHEDRGRGFVAVPDCYLGIIGDEDSRHIDWRTVRYHPGLPRYRMAAAGIPAANGVLFIGGSDNPYNYDGIGYNGEPSEPAAGALLFDIDEQNWRVIDVEVSATMDHRGLAAFKGQWITVGGMAAEQRVTDRVVSYRPK
jgi:hypothetical protein